jgi:hypothetical protein
MIKNVAGLLSAIAQKEAELLDSENIKHGPTIGDMYEGLTRALLEQAIPEHVPLKVVSGFAEGHNGELSNQLDCMLVLGEGTQVPYTDSFKWPIENVIAILEVKKSLYSAGIKYAFHQLRGGLEVYSNWIKNVHSNDRVDVSPSLRVFEEVTGQALSSPADLPSLTEETQLIYHTIVGDQFSPIRIAFGYDGFKSEHGLRQGFVSFLADNLNKLGYGPHSIPQLLVGGQFSLVKFSGHPYHSPMSGDEMVLVASSSANPMGILLELIWTRLSYDCPMPALFGEDLEFERMSPLIYAQPEEREDQPGSYGWRFRVANIGKKTLAQLEASEDWEPTILSVDQYVVIDQLCKGQEVDASDKDFISFAEQSQSSVADFVEALVKTGLVARSGNALKLTTIDCQIVFMPDGKCLAAENNTGRLSRWVEKQSVVTR